LESCKSAYKSRFASSSSLLFAILLFAILLLGLSQNVRPLAPLIILSTFGVRYSHIRPIGLNVET
jgi:hypothetical protein